MNFLIAQSDCTFGRALQEHIHKIGYDVAGFAKSSSETIRLIESLNPDFILIDFNIKGNLSAKDLAYKVQKLNIPSIFLFSDKKKYDTEFITDINHFDQLKRPFSQDELKTSIDLIMDKLDMHKNNTLVPASLNSMIYKKRGELLRISIYDILYVKAADDYTITVTPNEDFVSSIRLFNMEEKLSNYGFFKTHRSFLVNPSKVSSIDKCNNQLLVGSHKVPISRNNKSYVINLVENASIE